MPNSMEFEKTDIELSIVQGNFGKLVGLLKEQLQTHGKRKYATMLHTRELETVWVHTRIS